MIGNVEAVEVVASGNVEVRGWACVYGLSSSIAVHLYVVDPSGANTGFVAQAAQSSEAAISSNCATQTTPHRFVFSLSPSQRQQHANKLINVYGISPDGVTASNKLLPGSGYLRITPPLVVTRKYSYNAQLELCKVVEPETGATIMEYDAAGNLAWSASGLPSSTACGSTAASVVARKATRTYDARNRVASLSFPDGRGNLTYDYDAAGQLEMLTADNGNNDIVRTQYVRNRRGLLEREVLMWTNANINWPVYYTYNDLGHLAAQKWHDQTVDFAPNALGQPSKVGAYATGAKYYPNGALKEFTYGNGIVHTMTQNRRQLPEVSRDSYLNGISTIKVIEDSYNYDVNGNVAAITDGATGRNQRGNRTMVYDGLDRLKRATSAMFGNDGSGAAAYSYDGADNLTRVTVNTTPNAPFRDHYYCYEAGTQHLTNVKTGGCSSSGTTVIGLGYDEQGNLENKNGQVYEFDFGNRLRRVSTNSDAAVAKYVYDGSGRRVRDWTTAGSKYAHYSQSGQLLEDSNTRNGVFSEYFYLSGSLVAVRERSGPSTAYVYTNKYQHTDALGSPVAVSDDRRIVLERVEYEPYGKVLVPATAKDGAGFTGHVLDAATSLNYAQQRYYDPLIGRFLSADPVVASVKNGVNFNRYWYANNNPFRFMDPDGRCATRDKGGRCLVSVDSATGEAGAKAGKQLETVLNAYDKPINALPDKATFEIKDRKGNVIGTMTGKEIKQIWNGTAFRISNKSFPNGGAGGGTTGSWSLFGRKFSGTSELNPGAVQRYGDAAQTYVGGSIFSGHSTLIFHELGHVTNFGMDLVEQFPVTEELSIPREAATSSAAQSMAGAVGAPFNCNQLKGGCQ